MSFSCDEKLKVCFILGMFHPVINGAIIQISSLAERLTKKGISVMVITTKLFSQQPYLAYRVAPNLVNRQFSADAPNKLWATDITYLWTMEG